MSQPREFMYLVKYTVVFCPTDFAIYEDVYREFSTYEEAIEFVDNSSKDILTNMVIYNCHLENK